MKLGLGTAQFGMDYGISNRRGRVADSEVTEILELAAGASLRVIDTAPAYGDCEALLGRLLPKNHGFRIVTKTIPIENVRIHSADVQRVRDGFSRSLEALRQPHVEGLLLHHVEELFRPGGEMLLDLLQDLARRRLVRQVGVSVYTGEQIDRCLKLFKPDIIQVPVNVLDQRLIRSGHLSKLYSSGIKTMARSTFLQGLLLMDDDQIGPHFQKALGTIRKLRSSLTRVGASPLEGALLFLKARTDVDTTLVGVAGAQEFRQILAAWQADCPLPSDMSEFALEDESILNPMLWPAGQS